MYLASCCSEQMDIPESIDVTINVMPVNCFLEHVCFDGGRVMVWAGIHHDGRTALVRVNGALNVQIYRDEVAYVAAAGFLSHYQNGP